MRGAASRWCFHLLGASPHDPYAAYVSGRHAAEARGGVRRPRTAPDHVYMIPAGKGLRIQQPDVGLEHSTEYTGIHIRIRKEYVAPPL